MSETDSQEPPTTDLPERASPTGTAEKPVPRARRTGRIAAWVLVVLASLLIPVSVISVWAIRTVTNTDKYVATMAPLARNQVIVDHLATKATDELFSTHYIQDKVTDLMPAKAKPIVQPIVNQLQGYVYQLALKVFESPKFGQLWDALNRHSHEAVIDVLTGKQTRFTQTIERGGKIVVNVTPMLNNIISEANSRGVTLFNPLKPILSKGDSLGVVIVSKDQVSKYSGWFNLIVTLKWVIPVVALVLGILAVVLALEHRKTLLRLAVGVALVTLLLLAVLALGRISFLNQAAGHGFDRQVAAAVWDTLIRYLKTDLRWTLLIAALVALGCWLAGPARYAVWIRSTCAKGGRWLAAQVGTVAAGAGRAAAGSDRARHSGNWVLEHVKGLRIVGVVVAALFVVFGGNLTGWGLVVIIVLLAIYLGLVQLVAVWARKVSSPAAGAQT